MEDWMMNRIMFFRQVRIFLLICSPLFAQDQAIDDTVFYELEPIRVSALRFPEVSSRLPFSVSRIEKSTLQQARQQLSLREAVAAVPGLFSLNTYNFAQDLRISIRGFGARGAFGIRGIKFLMDGIPITTPDGQTSIDQLDLNIIDHLEIIRGPVSALYGNASGGVINLSSGDLKGPPFMQIRLAAGAYGFRQWQIQAGQPLGNTRYRISALKANHSGYRQNSGMESLLLNGLVDIDMDSSSLLSIHLNFEDSPLADDPGSLTREQAANDPAQAAAANIAYHAGESVIQGQAAVSYRHWYAAELGYHMYLAYSARKFSNRLPFSDGGWVDLARHTFCAGFQFEGIHPLFNFKARGQIGLEAASQNDHRKRFDNLEGMKGAPVFNQKETVGSIGIYVQEQVDITESWRFQAGLRYDVSQALARDYFNPADSAGSGERFFRGFSGLLGLSWQVHPAVTLYANLSSGFEIPALIELSNNPQGPGGLNPDLQAQELLNMEGGLKGVLLTRFRYELAAFQITVDNGLVPYEFPTQPDRTFYRNAGRSLHRGIETTLQGALFPGMYLSLTYTFSNFTYVSFPVNERVYDGNKIPGIPAHHFFSEIFYTHQSGLYARLEIQGTGRIYTSDANNTAQKAYWLMQIQAGWQQRVMNWVFEPFLGLNNLLNTEYADNIRINAYGGRYFEPAPPLNAFAGLSVKYTFQKK